MLKKTTKESDKYKNKKLSLDSSLVELNLREAAGSLGLKAKHLPFI